MANWNSPPLNSAAVLSLNAEKKHDPRNYTKLHETDALIRVPSCDFAHRFMPFIAAYHFSAYPYA